MIVTADTIRSFEETFTGYCATIDSDHAYIHKGLGFQYPCTFSLGNAATKGCIIKTPNADTAGRYIHWRPTRVASSAAAVKIELYESPTYSGGSQLSGIVNMNRNSTRTPENILWDGTLTITDNGDLISIDIVGGGGNPSSVAGGTGGNENEILLASNKEYLLLFTNITTTTTQISADLYWYEEGQGV